MPCPMLNEQDDDDDDDDESLCCTIYFFFRLWMYNYFTIHSAASNFNVLYHAVMFLTHKVRVLQEHVRVSSD